MKPRDLLGAKEAAALLGMSLPNFCNHVRRGNLPEPYATLACGRIWLRSQLKPFTE